MTAGFSFLPPNVGKGDVVDFYINTAGTIISESTIPGNTSLGAKATFNKAIILTPNGDTLDNYIILEIRPEYYYTPKTDSLDWHHPGGFIYSYTVGVGGMGIISAEVDNDYFYYHVGDRGFFAEGVACGGSKVLNTGHNSAKPIRIRIKAVRA